VQEIARQSAHSKLGTQRETPATPSSSPCLAPGFLDDEEDFIETEHTEQKYERYW
jgi:hypothetical protein